MARRLRGSVPREVLSGNMRHPRLVRPRLWCWTGCCTGCRTALKFTNPTTFKILNNTSAPGASRTNLPDPGPKHVPIGAQGLESAGAGPEKRVRGPI